MSPTWLRLGVFLSVLLSTSWQTAVAQERDRAFTSGLSLGLGVGVENSGLGAHALYYQQLSERWRVAPHVGVGWVGATGVAGGLMTTFGRRHRLVIDVLTGPVAVVVAATGDTNVKTRIDYGVCALVGWEWMARFGLAIRSSVGLSYLPLPAFFGRDRFDHILSGRDRFNIAINLLSVDYKLW